MRIYIIKDKRVCVLTPWGRAIGRKETNLITESTYFCIVIEVKCFKKTQFS